MRMYLKNNKKILKKRRLIIIFLLILILSFLFYIISINISYFYLNYSVREARQIIENAISSAVTDDILEDIKDKNLFSVTMNSSNEIEMIDYDSYLVNTFLRDVTDNIYNTLKKEEKDTDAIAFYIPLGSILKNPIFNSKGPKIPVRMEIIGSVLSGVEVKVNEYGINNSLIEMVVKVEVSEKVILPMITDDIKVVNEIPFSYKIIKGKIPNYYGDSLNKFSSIYKTPID